MKIIDVGNIQEKYGDWLPDDMKLPDHGAIIEGDKAEIANLGSLLYRDVTVFEANDPKQGESVSDVVREMRDYAEQSEVGGGEIRRVELACQVRRPNRCRSAQRTHCRFWRSTRAIEEATK